METMVRGPYLPLHALCGGYYFTLDTESDETICTVKQHPSESIEETKARAEYIQRALQHYVEED